MEKENIIWTVLEVAKYLGCNLSSLRKLVRNVSYQYNYILS